MWSTIITSIESWVITFVQCFCNLYKKKEIQQPFRLHDARNLIKFIKALAIKLNTMFRLFGNIQSLEQQKISFLTFCLEKTSVDNIWQAPFGGPLSSNLLTRYGLLLIICNKDEFCECFFVCFYNCEKIPLRVIFPNNLFHFSKFEFSILTRQLRERKKKRKSIIIKS